MRFDYKKIKAGISAVCCAFCLLLSVSHLVAEPDSGFTVENAELKLKGAEYILNASIKLHFSKEALKALEHGIALQIDTVVRVKQTRKWLWDQIIYKTVLGQKLQYHPLSNQYLVTHINTGRNHHFQNLQQALKFMKIIRAYPLANLSLKMNKRYTAQIRTQLNKKSLPKPLRMLAYIDPDWRLNSLWFSLALQ